MIRGMMKIKCPHCGKTFVAPDIEWHATALSAPVTCPHCKTQVDPNGIRGIWWKFLGLFVKKETNH